MTKKAVLPLLLAVFCAGFTYAQMPEGLEISVSVDVNAFEFRQIEKSDVELRKEAGENVGRNIHLPFSDNNWYSGTGVSFSYDGGVWGGSFSLHRLL